MDLDFTGYHGHPDFYTILRQMAKVHSAKNHDYAEKENPLSNLTSSVRIDMEPWIATWIRIQDKISRVEQFIKNQGKLEVKDESVEDTLIDLANYAVLCLVLYKESKNE